MSARSEPVVMKATSACIAARWPSATRLPRGDSPAPVAWPVMLADALVTTRSVRGLTASLALSKDCGCPGIGAGQSVRVSGTISAVLWVTSPLAGSMTSSMSANALP
jgi:hypothetical protein